MERLSLFSIGVVASLILACSGCTATVTYQHEDAGPKGVRYYESAPYLLVYSDGKGGLKWQIYYIPDQSHIMTATPTVRGGKAQMTLYFVNGALSSSTVAGDTTTIPNAILAAAQAAIPLIAAAVVAEKSAPPPGFPKPYLYKIIVSGSAVEFRGGQGDSSIRVPLQKGPGG
jgi:hypothetical protein